MKHILILGAGFGGMHAYRTLRKKCKKSDDICITIINNHNYFLFTPMLHEAAFGAADFSHIVYPLQKLIRHPKDRFIEDTVVQIIPEENKVLTKHAQTFLYDYLLVALGGQTSFFNIPGARPYTHSLKTFFDAITLKNSILEIFEHTSEEEKISLAVIGGGATGVEITAQLAQWVRGTLVKLYSRVPPKNISITLFHDTPRLLPAFPGAMGQAATKELSRMGVHIHVSATIKEVQEKKLILSNNTVFPFDVAIWGGGVSPNTSAVMTQQYLDEGGFLALASSLLVEGLPNVLALGDTARYSQITGASIPRTAQSAMQQGKHAAKNIIRLLKGKKPRIFHYRHKGDILSLGDRYTINRIGKWVFSGKFFWFFRRVVFLVHLHGVGARIKVIVGWVVGFFTLRDTTRLE